MSKHWDTTEEAAKKSLCSNCVAFDISKRMDECMPGVTSDKDGRLGYCWMHNFKCHSARTCYTWAKGGPIDEDSVFAWVISICLIAEGCHFAVHASQVNRASLPLGNVPSKLLNMN